MTEEQSLEWHGAHGRDRTPAGPDVTPATTAHFKSARWPSTPFWVAVLLGLLAFVVFMAAASALFVFIIGTGIAFFLVPVVDSLERRGLSRGLGSILTVAVTMGLTVVVLGGVAYLLVQQGSEFVQHLPRYLDDLGALYRSLELDGDMRSNVDALVANVQENITGIDQATVVSGVAGGFLNLVGGIFAWFLLPFLLFYLVKDQPSTARAFRSRVPAPWKGDVDRMLEIVTGNFAKYFKAEFIVGAMMFLLVSVGLAVIGTVMDAPPLFQFAILLGLIALIMELVPQIGPILSYIPALILAIPSGFDVVIAVSVYYFVVFNIEGSVLVPKIQGDIVEFEGATVLLLITIGFALGGILGAIVALPLASIVRDLFGHFFRKAIEADLVHWRLEPMGPVAVRPQDESEVSKLVDLGGSSSMPDRGCVSPGGRVAGAH